jgi:RNA polymerase sigma-70 factor (ECF subfamily)
MKEIWEKFESRLRAFTMSKVNDKSVTDDIMQELFIRIHANIDRVKDETKIQSWIYQICRNLIIDHYRTLAMPLKGALQASTDPEDEYPGQEEKIHGTDRQGSFPFIPDREDEDRIQAPEGAITPDPFGETGSEDIMAEAIADMVKMMGNLPPEYCEALCLTELGNLNQKEYAEKIGISYSGVKSRVQRARKMLKDMLMNCCHYEFDKYGTVINIYPAGCCCCHN